MARKVHYSCDCFFAASWGLVTGFQSPFPWFYAVFFTVMIIHRARRDIERCRERYGEAWMEYEKRVPYLFIPVSALHFSPVQNANPRTVCLLSATHGCSWAPLTHGG